jgi:hypothetical protein
MVMTGRAKIETALAPSGARDFGAVICYEGIYIRDHWEQLTTCPWWYQHVPDIEPQMQWRRDVIIKTGQDWFELPSFYLRAERRHLQLRSDAEGAELVDERSGRRKRLPRPTIGGWTAHGSPESIHPRQLAITKAEIDEAVPLPPPNRPDRARRDGRHDLAHAMVEEFGPGMYPTRSVSSPLWICYHLWGFEGMMTMIVDRPDLVRYACARNLEGCLVVIQEAADAGASGIWIEECLTDMISPQAFATLVVPYVRPLVEAIRSSGMNSIYYFCGDPTGKWNHLLDVGADALSLEESKKGFVIDIEDVVDRVEGRCAVLGNLDAIDLLAHGTEQALRIEIARQVAAGRRNKGRFVMSLGSPVTPETPVSRVRLYCDLTHELGKA